MLFFVSAELGLSKDLSQSVEVLLVRYQLAPSMALACAEKQLASALFSAMKDRKFHVLRLPWSELFGLTSEQILQNIDIVERELGCQVQASSEQLLKDFPKLTLSFDSRHPDFDEIELNSLSVLEETTKHKVSDLEVLSSDFEGPWEIGSEKSKSLSFLNQFNSIIRGKDTRHITFTATTDYNPIRGSSRLKSDSISKIAEVEEHISTRLSFSSSGKTPKPEVESETWRQTLALPISTPEEDTPFEDSSLIFESKFHPKESPCLINSSDSDSLVDDSADEFLERNFAAKKFSL